VAKNDSKSSIRRADLVQMLRYYRLHPSHEMYSIGTFDKAVTVLSQQNRALSLAYLLVENKILKMKSGDKPSSKVAIIGAGFAGLTVAAALIEKGVDAEI